MVLLIDLSGDWLVDPLLRLPIALALDQLIGPVWKAVHKTANRTGNQTAESSPTVLAFLCSIAESGLRSEASVMTAALLCWIALKFLPRMQLLLFGVLCESIATAALIFYLITLSAGASSTSAVVTLVFTNILHAELISDLRHLRFFELMGCPGLGDIVGSRSSFIASSPWLTIWPNLPLVGVMFGGQEALQYFQRGETFTSLFWVATVVSALPVTFFLLDALRWRLYVCRTSLARGQTGIKMSVIGSYYACVDSFIWQSVGEEKVNCVYALAWMGKVAYYIVQSVFSENGSLWQTFSAIPSLFVTVTMSSYVTVFGFCWTVAYIYHEVFSRWLFSMDVVLNQQQASSHDMQKFDFSGHLFVFLYQANMAAAAQSTVDPMSRLLLFLFLFRLSVIPAHVRMYSQALSLEGTGQTKFFLKAVLDGAIVPFLLGMALFGCVWQAPCTTALAQIWDRNITLPLAPEFEMWIHSESLMAVGDLFVACIVAVLCTVAYPTSQVVPVGDLSHYWHRYLARVDFCSKIWLQVIRELAGIFIHLIIMAFMLEQLWRSLTTPAAEVMGWCDLMNFAVYFGRYADSNIQFSYTQHGIVSDVVCSYRCVIRELPTPDEVEFAEWKDVCGICQAPEDNRLTLCVFPCFHFFHRNCLEEWLRIRMVCPMCMRIVWLDNGLVKMGNLSAAISADELEAEEAVGE